MTIRGSRKSLAGRRRRHALCGLVLGVVGVFGAHAVQAQGPTAVFAALDLSTQARSIGRLNPDGSLTTLYTLPSTFAADLDFEISGNLLTLLLRQFDPHNQFFLVTLDLTTGIVGAPIALPECVSGVDYAVAKIKGGYVIAKTNLSSGDDLLLINPTTASCTFLYESGANQVQNNFFFNFAPSYDLAIHSDGSMDFVAFGWGNCTDISTRTGCVAMAIHRHIDTAGTVGPIDFFTDPNLAATGANPIVEADSAPGAAVWASGETNSYNSITGIPNDVFFFKSTNGAAPVATAVSLGPITVASPKDVDAGSELAFYTSFSADSTTRQAQLATASGAVETLETSTTGFFTDGRFRAASSLQVGTLKIFPPGQTELTIYEITGTNPITTIPVSSTVLNAFAERLLDFTAPPPSSPNDLTVTPVTSNLPLLTANANLKISATVTNAGTSNIPSAKVRVFLDLNSNLAFDSGEPLVLKTVTNVAAGSPKSVMGIFQKPPGGAYLAVAVADPDNLVSESNESNNVASTPLLVALPDLSVGALSTSTALMPPCLPPNTPGCPRYKVGLQATIVNGGSLKANNVRVQFAYSPGGGSTYLNIGAKVNAGTVAATGVVQATRSWLNVAPGTYTIRVTADPANTIHEGDETNNITVFTISVP